DKTQMTPLHVACSHGCIPVAKCLVEAGADLRSLDEEQMTPLHFACMEGNLGVAKLLFVAAELRGGWSTVSKMVTDQDREEQTALHLAVEGGHGDLAKLCLEKGANVNAVKESKNKTFHKTIVVARECIFVMIKVSKLKYLSFCKSEKIKREILLYFFDVVIIICYIIRFRACIECRDKDKDTPLMIAAEKNHVDTVRTLLQHGADIAAKDINDRNSVFRAAAEGCMETLEAALEHQKPVWTICDDVCLNGLVGGSNKLILVLRISSQLLLDNGACIDSKNDEDITPIHYAAKFGRVRTVCALLKRDPAIINDEDGASNTPLHLAALHGHAAVVKELLYRGGAIDARNATLWTPLDCAAARGMVEVANILLDEDAPVDPTDKAKTTPLHLASREGHVEMVKLLLSRKANITLTDSAGRNCLDIAIESSHKEVAVAIIDHVDWKQAMRNRCKLGNAITSPMRKLIKKLPGQKLYLLQDVP
ncbi:predicted protein, partial [Nematostella vectensis]